MSYNFRYRQFAQALYHALKEDPFYITMEASMDDDSAEEGMLRYLDYSIQEAATYGELFIPKGQEYGISVWSKPIEMKLAQKKNRQKKDFINRHMGRNSLATYSDIVRFMSEKSAFLISDRYWYLSIVGVLPDYQGKGLGIKLVDNILQHTDDAKIPTYLETFTPRNMTFYNRLGYQVLDSFSEPTTGAKYWLMSRAINRRQT